MTKWRDQREEEIKALRGLHVAGADHMTKAAKLQAERMLLAIPADTRDLTQRLFGDPLPGRSALDQARKQLAARMN